MTYSSAPPPGIFDSDRPMAGGAAPAIPPAPRLPTFTSEPEDNDNSPDEGGGKISAVYNVITDRILTALQAGVCPWRMPWALHGEHAPKNLISKRAYRGINVFLLTASRYQSPWWLSYKQAKALGGQVRKGEKATPIIYYRLFDDRRRVGRKIPMLRYYQGFNLQQCDGVEAPVVEGEPTEVLGFSPIQAAEVLLDSYHRGPTVRHGATAAAYHPTLDEIVLPNREDFSMAEEYYSTRFHEEVHGTGHATRLNREGVTNAHKFGDHGYSFEELVAEMGAAFLSGECGILDTTIDNSAAYLQHWVTRLKGNPKWLIQAGGKASAAADFILGRSKTYNDDSQDDD